MKTPQPGWERDPGTSIARAMCRLAAAERRGNWIEGSMRYPPLMIP